MIRLVKVRLSGDPADVDVLAELIGEHAEVVDVSTDYANRRAPGVRRYLTIAVTGQAPPPAG
ncbi:hypothetical protein [Actinomadura macrotermitis]|uniref:Lrp/AsnC family transcriptional regulator n=1 Tax=Actinomadura macrotermitis TaxID=2585200 RepID=A0A7K0C1A0_9ACTN|nr:hypothetical protein [Actinomadura macrotermitis]MQY07243.1 hypothetical protein [Actinomadura macrotermitis]